MQQYKITFGVELNAEKLCAIERDFGIPAHFDTIYIEANSPRHAIRLFCEKYGISRRIIRTSDLLKIVYVVRPGGKHGFLGFRVSGLEWKKDFETLQKKSFSLFFRPRGEGMLSAPLLSRRLRRFLCK